VPCKNLEVNHIKFQKEGRYEGEKGVYYDLLIDTEEEWLCP
jgi:hypothetical protein